MDFPTERGREAPAVPNEVCEALDVGPGDKITWEVNGGRVAVTTERPGLWRWKGFIKHGPATKDLGVASHW